MLSLADSHVSSYCSISKSLTFLLETIWFVIGCCEVIVNVAIFVSFTPRFTMYAFCSYISTRGEVVENHGWMWCKCSFFPMDNDQFWNVLVIVSYTQRRKRTVFCLYTKIWLHYFYLTCKMFLAKILSEPKVSTSLYILYWALYTFFILFM